MRDHVSHAFKATGKVYSLVS